MTPREGVRERALWLVWSNEHKAWWGPNRSGYYVDIAAAGRYSYADAVDICNGRDFPWPPTVRRDESGHETWPENPPELIVPAPEHFAPAHPAATAREEAWKAMVEALTYIASHRGLTLLGDGSYSDGVRDGWIELADAADRALALARSTGGE